MTMLTIGITGTSGSGKSMIASIFADRHGFHVIDADKLARETTQPGSPLLPALAAEFGMDIICSDGTLDRRLLARRAFATEETAKRLNELSHPAILTRVKQELRRLADKNVRFVIYDAPLLFESGSDSLCDYTVAVIAPTETKLRRIVARDGISADEARQRLARQQNDEYYKSRADYLLFNGEQTHTAELEAAVTAIVRGSREISGGSH